MEQMRRLDVLLGIISRICEKTGVNLAFDTISTLDDDSVFVRMQKFFVEKMLPNGMHQFPATMSFWVAHLA
jgi:hypothetical protein